MLLKITLSLSTVGLEKQGHLVTVSNVKSHLVDRSSIDYTVQ